MCMFDQLKSLMQNGERYIMVEAGRPEYVLMRFDDYSALVKSRKNNPGGDQVPERNPADWGRINSELEEGRLGETLHSEFTAEPLAPAPDPNAIRLEDLPL